MVGEAGLDAVVLKNSQRVSRVLQATSAARSHGGCHLQCPTMATCALEPGFLRWSLLALPEGPESLGCQAWCLQEWLCPLWPSWVLAAIAALLGS